MPGSEGLEGCAVIKQGGCPFGHPPCESCGRRFREALPRPENAKGARPSFAAATRLR